MQHNTVVTPFFNFPWLPAIWNRKYLMIALGYILIRFIFTFMSKITASFIEGPRTISTATLFEDSELAKCQLFQCIKFLSTVRYYYYKATAIIILTLTVSLYNISAILHGFYLKYFVMYIKINLTSQGISVSHDPHFT